MFPVNFAVFSEQLLCDRLHLCKISKTNRLAQSLMLIVALVDTNPFPMMDSSVKPFSANPIKCSNTVKQFIGYCR